MRAVERSEAEFEARGYRASFLTSTLKPKTIFPPYSPGANAVLLLGRDGVACFYSVSRYIITFLLKVLSDHVTTRSPNTTDYSCRFEFGVESLPLEKDEISQSPCLAICSQRAKPNCGPNPQTPCAPGGELS